MMKIRCNKSIFTRADEFCHWVEERYISLRAAKQANRGNLTPCVAKQSMLPARQERPPEVAEVTGEAAEVPA